MQFNENELISSKESSNEQIKQNISSNEKKRKRIRRRRTCVYSRRKRRKYFDKEQFWMKKYSIEPFSIPLLRCQLPD